MRLCPPVQDLRPFPRLLRHTSSLGRDYTIEPDDDFEAMGDVPFIADLDPLHSSNEADCFVSVATRRAELEDELIAASAFKGKGASSKTEKLQTDLVRTQEQFYTALAGQVFFPFLEGA